MALDIQKLGAMGARLGFAFAGNAKVDVVLNLGAGSAGVYDPRTDTMTPGATVDVPLKVLAYQTKEQQALAGNQDEANTTTVKTYLVNLEELRTELVRQGATLPPMGAEITETDTVTEEGALWHILSVAPDPSKATTTLVARK